MPSTSDIAAKMVAAMRLVEPNVDTSVGTLLRSILDVTSEAVAEASTDAALVQYQYDIDSKVEGDLDEFVALFGFTRIAAKRATGFVTFNRPNDTSAATTTLLISPGTQVVAITNPLQYVQTTVGASMSPGQTSVDIPVQAVEAGPQGNVAGGLLVNLVSPVAGITSVTNAGALSGGTAPETDEQLRARFKATVFRNLAGTESMYLATAQEVLSDPNDATSRVNGAVSLVGSSLRYREQIQVVSHTATSSVTNAAYIFSDNVYCGNDIDTGDILAPGSQFTFTPTNPTDRSNASATLTLNSALPDGVYELDFEYVPQWSRNDPANTRYGQGSVNNRVDIWVNGINPDVATQNVIFSNALLFSSSSSSPYYNARWAWSSPGTVPTAGWVFIPLAFGPILSVPSSITIAGTTYNYQTDYNFAFQSDAFGLAANSLSGLAWNPAKLVANGTVFPFTYTYNRAIRDTQEAIRTWRLLGTDALVHAGRPIRLKFSFAIVYDPRFDVTAVNTEIDSVLASFINGLGFNNPVQVSDVINVVHSVPGVDNVRFLNSSDNPTTYAIARISQFSTTQLQVYNSGGRAIDVTVSGSEYPLFYATNIVQKAPNTFGVA